jgi:hypothetical protein
VPITIAYVGDLMLAAEDSAEFLDDARPFLRRADVAVGHVEWPHTDRGQVCAVDIPAPAVPPAHLDALSRAGIAVATLAGNHMFDQGPFGVQDTVAGLRSRGIETCGAGADLASARRPAIVEAGGLRAGFLSYNAVGPRESWATPVKAGVAPVRVHSHYELDIASPGSRPSEHTSVDVDSAAELCADIAQLREQADIVSVSFHKGMGFVRAELAQYERPLARMAVDAGADIVIGHHAHILRGVEVYRGRPVFHGINHFAPAYTDATNPLGNHGNRPRPRRAPSIDFFQPDTSVANFPFPVESRHTMIAVVVADTAGVLEAGFVPCYLDRRSRPVPFGGADRGGETTDYIRAITAEAGLDARIADGPEHAVFFRRETGGEGQRGEGMRQPVRGKA